MILFLILGGLLLTGGSPGTGGDAVRQLELCRQALAKQLPLQIEFSQELEEDGTVTLSERGMLSLQDARRARWQYQGEGRDQGQVWVIRDERYLWYQPEDRLLRKGTLGPQTRAGLWSWLLGTRDLDRTVRVSLDPGGWLRLDFPDGEVWWLRTGPGGLPQEMRVQNGDNPDWTTVYRFSRYRTVDAFPSGTFDLSPPEGTEVVEEP